MALFIPNNRTIELIQASQSFKMNQNQLAVQLKTTRQDAGQELLIDLMAHRLKENITVVDAELSKVITYSRKAVAKRYFDELKQQQLNEVSDGLIDIENVATTMTAVKKYELTNDTFNTIVKCFHSTQYGLVQWLLLQGEERTKEHFGDSAKVFNQKVKRLIKYVEAHHATFEQELTMNVEKDALATIDAIDHFFHLYESPDFVSNEQITEAFEEYQDLLPFTEALDKVHYEGKLFDDWRGYTERNEFLLELNHQQQVLLDKVRFKTS